MRILLALAGLHRVDRGAEVAFTSLAAELSRAGHSVTLIGSGPERPGAPYSFRRAGAIDRTHFERFPRLPALRQDTAWEEATFLPGLLRRYRPADHDVTITCSYPFTSWALRRPVWGGRRPAHVFVTQNGDWPALRDDGEFRWFGCEGLVCTNPDYYERNRERYRAALIPNGVDIDRFTPGPAERERFGIDSRRPVVLMVSALIASKNVADGIRAVSLLPDAMLVVAGDGPFRQELRSLAEERIPGRYLQLSVPAASMPSLFRSADAFLHLSRDESFGNVFVEAMACGVPIVAHDLSRTRWIVDEDAFLAVRDTPEAIAEQLAEALQSQRRGSPQLIRRARQFSWPTIAARYADFLEEVVTDWKRKDVS